MKQDQLPRATVAVVTEEQVRKATPEERCRLMREIIRGATYSPSIGGKKT